MEDGFGPRQRVTVGTLATIAAQAAERGVRSPAVVVVGDVVRLSPYTPAAVASLDLTFDPSPLPKPLRCRPRLLSPRSASPSSVPAPPASTRATSSRAR
ncbi:hypothetical protein HR12_23290 [Microbacterium sp. SUBG005]|nr:hypothetical protein HR12_23290 [Microbacterium sp. SUBG005]